MQVTTNITHVGNEYQTTDELPGFRVASIQQSTVIHSWVNVLIWLQPAGHAFEFI